jgi:hypothetical protein
VPERPIVEDDRPLARSSILAVAAGGAAHAALARAARCRVCDLVLYATTPGLGATDGITEGLDPIESHVLRPYRAGTIWRARRGS